MFNSLRINEQVAQVVAGFQQAPKPVTEGAGPSEGRTSPRRKAWIAQIMRASPDHNSAMLDGMSDEALGNLSVRMAKKEAKERSGVKEAEGDKPGPEEFGAGANQEEPEEKKGGPAELAADLRVSIRIEKMGIGRYKRMLAKHALSSTDEKWLKRRIEELEACVKEMEDKLPELEKEGKGTDLKEAMIAEFKAVVAEVLTGKYRE